MAEAREFCAGRQRNFVSGSPLRIRDEGRKDYLPPVQGPVLGILRELRGIAGTVREALINEFSAYARKKDCSSSQGEAAASMTIAHSMDRICILSVRTPRNPDREDPLPRTLTLCRYSQRARHRRCASNERVLERAGSIPTATMGKALVESETSARRVLRFGQRSVRDRAEFFFSGRTCSAVHSKGRRSSASSCIYVSCRAIATTRLQSRPRHSRGSIEARHACLDYVARPNRSRSLHRAYDPGRIPTAGYRPSALSRQAARPE